MREVKHNPLSFQLNVEKFSRASDDAKSGTNLMRPNTTFFKDAVKRFVKNPVAMTAFVFLVIVILGVIFIPIFWPYSYDLKVAYLYVDPGQTNVVASFNKLQPMQYAPIEQEMMATGKFIMPHLLGTDANGHDYFICLIVGMRTSLIIGFFAAIIVLIIGGIIGSLCGFLGGKFDLIVMRIVDVIYCLPDILIIILLGTALAATFANMPSGSFLSNLGSGFVSIFIVFGCLYWVGMCRLVRGQILSLRKQEYIMAAKASGASTWRIILKHLIPNSMSVIIISAALQIPSAIFTESFLSYLGLGVKYPNPSLGSLASNAQDYITAGDTKFLYLFFVPAIAICLLVLSLNLLGDGLRDAFDPKLQK